MNGNKEVLETITIYRLNRVQNERNKQDQKIVYRTTKCDRRFFCYMSRYCRNFIRILTLANRIKSHFFAGAISSNSEGMYSYIKHTQNRLKNADKILMIKVIIQAKF